MRQVAWGQRDQGRRIHPNTAARRLVVNLEERASGSTEHGVEVLERE